MTLFGNKKILLEIILINLFLTNLLFAIENKIILKIDNEIITSLEIEIEKNNLRAMNPKLDELNSKDLFLISKNSLIREKIKTIEILKYVDDLTIDKKILNDFIKRNYSKMGIKSLNDYKSHLKFFGTNLEKIKKKLTIEIIWNQIIYSKFNTQVKINENDLKTRLQNKKSKKYLLSEILFTVSNEEDLKLKFNEIKKKVIDLGFENAASTYSISDSAKTGGEIGWIKESSLNKEISNRLKNLKKNQLSNPIITPGGFLILKFKDVIYENIEINLEDELKNLMIIERNRQLNQFSNIYFNKIKKNTKIYNEL